MFNGFFPGIFQSSATLYEGATGLGKVIIESIYLTDNRCLSTLGKPIVHDGHVCYNYKYIVVVDDLIFCYNDLTYPCAAFKKEDIIEIEFALNENKEDKE